MPVTPEPPAARNERWPRILAVVLSALVYGALAVAMFPMMKTATAPLSILPILVAGIAFGARGGMIAGLAVIPFNLLLFSSFGILGELVRNGRIAGTLIGSLVGVGVGYAVGSFRDVLRQRDQTARERERAQRLLRESEKLRLLAEHREQMAGAEHLASLGALAAGVAHDVNNPLAFLTANLNYLLGQISENAPMTEEARQEWREILNESVTGAARIREIVRGLQLFASPSGIEAQATDARAALEAALSLLEPRLRQHARLEKDIQSVPLVKAVPARLRELFAHLLVNAIDAVERSKAVKPLVQVQLGTDARGWVLATLRGNGASHSEAALTPGLAPSTPGLGICRSIVEDLGGELRFTQDGEALELQVALPAALSAGAGAGTVAPRPV